MSLEFSALSPSQQAARMQAAGADVLSHWGLAGASLKLIKYRENAVFRVQHDDTRHALRIHRHGYHSDAELWSELQWMRALEEYGIKVPRAIPTADGNLFVTHEASGLPGVLQVDLFEWIDGQQLGSVEEGLTDPAQVAPTFATIGSLAAQVHNQASTWTVPQGFVRHAWDEHGLAGEAPFWGRFWELESASDEQRDLMVRGRDAVFRGLAELDKTPGVYSMIHADFAPENVLVDGDEIRLIDFDDAGFGWHLFELATSLYFISGEPCIDVAQAWLIEGYRRHRPLPDSQLALLPLFLAARGFTYVGWVHTRQETETARELTPMLLDMACTHAQRYLSQL